VSAPRASARAAAEYLSRHGMRPHEAAGLAELRHVRSTGALVALYDGEAAGLDTEGGRWSTVCEAHGTVCAHDTKTLARSWMSDPDVWCEDCRAAMLAEVGR
jgi:hypothetical protein